MKNTHSQIDVHSWSHNIDGSHWLCDTNCHMSVVCCWPTWNAYALWWTNIDMAEAWAMNGNKPNKTEKNWNWKYGNIMLSPAFDFRQFNLSKKCQPHHIRQYLSQSPKCRLRLKNSPENQILVCTHNTHPEPPLKDEAICDSRIRCCRFDEALVAECYSTRCAHA